MAFKRIRRMTVFLFGAAAGAAAMYYFDPRSGRERRSEAGEQLAPLAKQASETLVERGSEFAKQASETIVEKGGDIATKAKSAVQERVSGSEESRSDDRGADSSSERGAWAPGESALPPPVAGDVLPPPDVLADEPIGFEEALSGDADDVFSSLGSDRDAGSRDRDSGDGGPLS